MRTNELALTYTIAESVLALTCVLAPEITRADPISSGIHQGPADCSSDTSYYFFIGNGVGASPTAATQGAMLDARKNAIMCLFGGSISYDANIRGSNHSLETASSTSVSLTAEDVDWSAFELLASEDTEANGSFTSTLRFRWSKRAITKIKATRDIVRKEKQKSRALEKVITAADRKAADREALIVAQEQELAAMRRHQFALLSAAARSDKVVAELEKRKREQSELDQQWLNMVLRFGCGVTLTELKSLLGSPDSIEVYSIRDKTYRYRPLLYYVYGNFALVAPVFDVIWPISFGNDTKAVRRDAWRYQVTEVTRYKGDGATWIICNQQ